MLLQTDEERRRFAAWSVTIAVRDHGGPGGGGGGAGIRHERVIPYRGGHADGVPRCPFLGDDDRCTIYEDRPLACRRFECTRHFNQHGVGRHGLFLRGNPRVAAVLTSL